MRKLLVLPFLPHNHIENVLRQLAARANTEPLRNLVEYIDTQWIRSNVFPVQSWCVFKHRVRTNNDVEGWHTRLNGDCGNRALTFYRLVPALRKQAEESLQSHGHQDLEHLE
ncbi:uncharacterized protein LOC127851635 [Dreissena polymorpha]|uniref:Uncharacterized protein n=1 Tax=Dreissena polymorpha TaxID=45954 RepID=A0A9D4D5Z2_DREPO|nr:uncharacterized protein LOC127851635 [Dreissena polymorpha]KAH3739786.1 hypothetical protein DPMN_046474 [Dreissena polymorpha]